MKTKQCIQYKWIIRPRVTVYDKCPVPVRMLEAHYHRQQGVVVVICERLDVKELPC